MCWDYLIAVVQVSVLLQSYDNITNLLTNGSAAFIWKLHSHWLKGLRRHLQWYDNITSLLTNGSAAFIWKLRSHWLKGLRQRHITVIHMYKPQCRVFLYPCTHYPPCMPHNCTQWWSPFQKSTQLVALEKDLAELQDQHMTLQRNSDLHRQKVSHIMLQMTNLFLSVTVVSIFYHSDNVQSNLFNFINEFTLLWWIHVFCFKFCDAIFF